jgi:hypothetical protein
MIGKVWAWCKRSATIVWARVQYIVGLVSAGLIVAFSGYDFTSLTSLDWRAAFKVLVAVAVSGVLTELARRRTLPKSQS